MLKADFARNGVGEVNIRTDLALECREMHPEGLPGVSAESRETGGVAVTTVHVRDAEGARAMGKPQGTYITLELPPPAARFGRQFEEAVQVLADSLRPLLPRGSCLIVGLGNPQITPDSLGPRCLRRCIKSRHLVEKLPEHFGTMRPVAAIQPGVLGTTGVESAELVRAVTEKIRPDCVLVVDALASRRLSRICRSIQISDSGITPGSGVGNARAELSKAVLGIPVIALGVPTVVDAATLISDLGSPARPAEPEPDSGDMIVTARNIDAEVEEISRILAYGINLALHQDLTMDDVDAFLD